MPRYDKSNTKELKEFLYSSYVHDAKLENVKYYCREDSIKIELFNPIYSVKIDLTFFNIGIDFYKRNIFYYRIFEKGDFQ